MKLNACDQNLLGETPTCVLWTQIEKVICAFLNEFYHHQRVTFFSFLAEKEKASFDDQMVGTFCVYAQELVSDAVYVRELAIFFVSGQEREMTAVRDDSQKGAKDSVVYSISLCFERWSEIVDAV